MSTPYDVQETPVPHPAVLALQRTQRRVKDLESYLAWEDQLFANPHLSATHKLTLRATRRAAEHGQTKDEEGRTRVYLGSIAEQIGVSSDTVSRCLKVLASSGAISKETKAEVDPKTGELKTRLYAALDEQVLHHPKEIAPPAPRNHGGARYTCQQCGSQEVKLRRQVFLVCKACRHEVLIEETEHDQRAEGSSEPQDAARPEEATGAANPPLRGDQAEAAPTRNMRPLLKPVSPPMSASAPDSDDEQVSESQDTARRNERLSADLHAAADLLVALAGPGEDHIEMCRHGHQKYLTIHQPLTEADVLAHLQGQQTLGAACRYPDGKTRGLLWDVDDAAGWQQMQDAARALADAGYLPLLEPSPAGRGGHLLLLFDALVDPGAARQQIYQLAPALADLTEYWPGPVGARHWNQVRLPGGKYVRPGMTAWCRLVSVAYGEIALNGGSEAAQLLLSHQTPASIIPELAQALLPLDQPVETTASQPTSQEPSDTHRLAGAATLDEEWQARYHTPEGQRLWFRFTPAYVAEWFNQRHALDELLPSEKNGYGLATWRGETEGSVAKRDGHWADFGQSARRADGSPDTGDALELATRISGSPKPEMVRQAAKALVAEARAALESAARNNQPIPAWLEAILSPAGQAHYERLCSGGQPSEHSKGGLTGFSPGSPATQADHGPPRLAIKKTLLEPSAEALALMEQYHLRHGTPCQCGCELSRELFGEWVCCRCLPPKGYSVFAEAVDRLYPPKHISVFWGSSQRFLLK